VNCPDNTVAALLTRLRRTPEPHFLTTRAAVQQELDTQSNWERHPAEPGESDWTNLAAVQQPLLDLHGDLQLAARRTDKLTHAVDQYVPGASMLALKLDLARDCLKEAATVVGLAAKDTADVHDVNISHGNLVDARIAARMQLRYTEELRSALTVQRLKPEASNALDEAVDHSRHIVDLLARVELPAPAPAH
jgi:hypothetical protein